MGHGCLNQQNAFPLYQPAGGIHSLQHQPGRCPVLNESAPKARMPEPLPMPTCPPGLEDL